MRDEVLAWRLRTHRVLMLVVEFVRRLKERGGIQALLLGRCIDRLTFQSLPIASREPFHDLAEAQSNQLWLSIDCDAAIVIEQCKSLRRRGEQIPAVKY